MLARAAVLRGSAPLHDPDCLSSWQIKNEHSRPPDGLRGTCCEMPRTQQFLTVPTISEVAFSYYLARNSFHRGPESSSVCKLFTSSFPPRAWGRRTRRPGPARAPVLTAPSGCGRDPAALKELEEVVTMETPAAALIGRDAQTPPPPSGAAGGVPRGRDFPGTSGKRAVLGYGSGSGVARGILGVAVRHRVRRTLRALRLGSAGGAGRGGAVPAGQCWPSCWELSPAMVCVPCSNAIPLAPWSGGGWSSGACT